MKFNFVLFSAIALLMGGTLVFVVACNKHDANDTQSSPSAVIASARHYFESSVLPVPASAATVSQNPRAALPKTPIWGMAYTTKTDLGEMVVVPVAVKSNIYLKINNGNQSFSAGLFTSLVVYKDGSGSYHAQLVTKIPDGSYVSDLSAGKKFSGVVLVEDWQGNFIKGYHYSNGVSDRYYASYKIVHRADRFGTTSLLEDPSCIISEWYECASDDNGEPSDCTYDYSVESCSGGGEGGDDGGSGGGGGGGNVYQNVYHYTGGGSGGSGGTWVSATNVGLKLCTSVNFTYDNGYLLANFNGVAETWTNSVQGSVSVNFPATCISVTNAPNPASASSVFDQAYDYARLQVTTGLNNGSILPADVSSKFAGYLGYYLHIGYVGSSWNVYSNCSVTAPPNSPSFCAAPEP